MQNLSILMSLWCIFHKAFIRLVELANVATTNNYFVSLGSTYTEKVCFCPRKSSFWPFPTPSMTFSYETACFCCCRLLCKYPLCMQNKIQCCAALIHEVFAVQYSFNIGLFWRIVPLKTVLDLFLQSCITLWIVISNSNSKSNILVAICWNVFIWCQHVSKVWISVMR